MKKIFPFLCFSVFFCSCPMEDLGPNNDFCVRVKNMSSQKLNYDVNFDLLSYSKNCEYYEDSVNIGEITLIHGFGYKEKPESPFDLLITDCANKHFVITSLSGDTLANWNDSSTVFDPKYWVTEEIEEGSYTCTLQLTDEVLKLK